MEEIYERVVKIAEYYRVSKPSEFAKKTGFSHQVATNYLKGKRNPTRESINTILITFPDVNSEWLLTGKQPMLKESVKEKQEGKSLSDIERENEFLRMEIELKNEIRRQDLELMDMLKIQANGNIELIKMLNERIKELEAKVYK